MEAGMQRSERRDGPSAPASPEGECALIPDWSARAASWIADESRFGGPHLGDDRDITLEAGARPRGRLGAR